MQQALLLDSSFYPLQMIDWKKALSLFFTGRAEVVENHDGVTIRSTHDEFKLPKVLRLYCKLGNINHVKFNRVNVLYRDNFICQYCGDRFLARDLTMDHVYPRSKGGDTDWNNIVAACAPCNNKKADKLIHECGMQPINMPKEPRWLSIILKKMNASERSLWADWFC